MRERGFTTLELAAAICLSGLLASVVFVEFASSLALRKTGDVRGKIEHLDLALRREARQKGQAARLIFDLSRREVRRKILRSRDSPGGKGREAAPAPARLPKGWKFDSLSLGGKNLRRRTSGQVTIHVSPEGHSRTYSFTLLSPGGARTRFLVCGLSGQLSEIKSEKDIRRILSQTRWPDAP